MWPRTGPGTARRTASRTISGRNPPQRREIRQADLRLDDDFLDLPLGGGPLELDDGDTAPPPHIPPPQPQRRGGWLIPVALLVLAAAAGGTYYLGLDPPLAVLSAEALDFGDARLDVGVNELSVELRNDGEKKLTVGEVSVKAMAISDDPAGAFTKPADRCRGGELRPGESCSVRLRFAPTARGDHQARLDIVSNAVNGVLALPLRGRGVEGELAFAPSRLDFGSVLVGDSGRTLRLWIENRGSADFVVEGVGLEGLGAADFIVADDACPNATLGPGERCGVAYRFVPTAEGLRRAEVTIRSQAPMPETTPWLVGLGMPREPMLRLEPQQLEFGAILAGETSRSQEVTIFNDGDADLTIGRLVTSLAEIGGAPRTDDAGFAVVTDECGERSVPPGESCRFEVAFQPRRQGDARAFFEIEHSAREGRHAVPVFGVGTAPGVAIDPRRLSFGEVPVASKSLPRVMRVVNSGTGPLRIHEISLDGADQRAFGPPASACVASPLQPGAGCTIELRFRPSRDGPHRAELVVRHSAGDGIHRLAVNGLGVSARLAVEPARLDLGEVWLGETHEGPVVLTNRGRAAIAIERLTLRGTYSGDFTLRSDDCSGSVIPPGGSCSATLRFAPRSAGTRNAVIRIVHRGDGPREVPVSASARSF